MVTKYNHVDRTGDQPAGIETLNRIGDNAKDLFTEFAKRHNQHSGAHFCPEVARVGGYVEIKNGVPILHQPFGGVYEVLRLGTGRYRIGIIENTGGDFGQLKVTPVGGFAVPVVNPIWGGNSHDVSLYSDATTLVDRSFVFQLWHRGQTLAPSIMPWTDRAVNRVWGASTSNTIATNLQKYFDLLGARHNTGTGATEDAGASLGGGFVSVSGGTYTLEEKYGFADTITKLGTGDVKINLSSSMQADGSDHWYRPLVTSMGARTVNYAETLGSTSFTVRLREVNDTAKDGPFSFHLFGIPA